MSHRNDKHEPLEVEQLRQMTLGERLDWMRQRFRQRMNLLFLKVDGHLVACGTEDEFDDMLARFLMFIARPTRDKAQTNWEG